jgi:HK97 family phage major capsid protein
LWNIPVVVTTLMPVNTFLIGTFRRGAQVFDRMDAAILISTENDKDFELNLATVRGEKRLAFAVSRPAAFITGSLVTP